MRNEVRLVEAHVEATLGQDLFDHTCYVIMPSNEHFEGLDPHPASCEPSGIWD